MKKDSLKLIIIYPLEKAPHKLKDSKALAETLTQMGHEVVLADVSKIDFSGEPGKEILSVDGVSYKASEFDGFLPRVALNNKSRELNDLFEQNGVFVFQGVENFAAADKVNSQKIFDNAGIPTPKTFCLSNNEQFKSSELYEFLNELENGPYVIKKSNGWNGDQVKILDNKQDLVDTFKEWIEEASANSKGGVLVQEFIDSAPGRKRDYRVQTIVGINADGEQEVNVTGAYLRIAKEGDYITNTTHGSDVLRVSLSEEDAFGHYVTKGKMDVGEFKQKVEDGSIHILTPELIKVAKDTALAFGPASLGVDIIVSGYDKKPKVLEINPFGSSTVSCHEKLGFEIYKPWAEAFESTVLYHISKHTEKPGIDITNSSGLDISGNQKHLEK
jgi:glutathione synthase/RimK-type ligase-like ATP-grasp enzyme